MKAHVWHNQTTLLKAEMQSAEPCLMLKGIAFVSLTLLKGQEEQPLEALRTELT